MLCEVYLTPWAAQTDPKHGRQGECARDLEKWRDSFGQTETRFYMRRLDLALCPLPLMQKY
jgi:hypothetical protein